MPASLSVLDTVYEILLEKKLDFQAKFPEILYDFNDYFSDLETHHIFISNQEKKVFQDVIQKSIEQYDEGKQQHILALSQEEIELVFFKIQNLVTHATELTKDEMLYLEQQLSDIVGFSVSTTNQEQTIPYWWGCATALPHTKRHPADQLKDHAKMQEADISTKRSMAGWQPNQLDTLDHAFLEEQYTLFLPLLFMEQYSVQADEISRLLNTKKVLVINPVSKKMAVAKLGSSYWHNRAKYALGLSPELSRDLETWRPPAQGNVFFLLIEDSAQTVPLGKITYDIRL